jgi:DNA invertase Pin-like site-specific DNA recombinase
MAIPCAIYLRVSKERGQTVEAQRPEVEQLARARGFEIVKVYEEQTSAVKHRPEYTRMLKDARRGSFSAILIWAIDRLGRSMVGNLADIVELDRIGVQVVSVRESWLDTGSAVRPLLVAICSWVAEQERLRLISRTRCGLEAARRRGIRLGRPPAVVDDDQLRDLRQQGKSVREIATVMNVGASTVQRRLRTASLGSGG